MVYSFNQPDRIAQAHKIAGLVGGKFSQRRLHRGDRAFSALPHRQPTNGIPVKADLDRLASRLGPHLDIGSALNDPKLGLIGPVVSRLRPFGPSQRAFHGVANKPIGTRQRWANI